MPSRLKALFPPPFKSTCSEFMGTTVCVFFQLMLFYAWKGSFLPGIIPTDTTGISLTGLALCSGAITTVVAYGYGHISGAHLNHAVTFAVASRGHMRVPLLLSYLVAQATASFVGAGLVAGVFGRGALDVVAPYPTGMASHARALLFEFILSTALALALVGTGSRGRTGALHYALSYGACVAAVVGVGAPWGARANPALAFGAAILGHRRSTVWIYVLGPWLGGLNAGVAAQLLFGRSADGPGLSGLREPARGEDEKAVLCGWDYTRREVKSIGPESLPLFDEDLLAQRAGQRSGQGQAQSTW